MKSFESSVETPKGCLPCSIRLRSHFFPNWEQKKTLKTSYFPGKCRIVPKNVTGDPFGLLTYILLQNIKKTRRGGPFTLIRFCRLRLKSKKGGPFGAKKISKKRRTMPKKIEGVLFALSLHWLDLSLGISSFTSFCCKKSGPIRVRIVF